MHLVAAVACLSELICNVAHFLLTLFTRGFLDRPRHGAESLYPQHKIGLFQWNGPAVSA